MLQQKLKIIAAMLLFASYCIQAQSNGLSLKESLIIGLQNSSEIKIAESQLKISDAQITKATSYLLPKLTLEGLYNHFDVVSPDKFQLGPLFAIPLQNPVNVYGGSVSIQQPLFTGLRTWAKKSAAEFDYKATAEELALQKNKKALEIQIAFWNLFKAQKIKSIVKNNLTALENHLKQTEQFFINGLATQNDLLKLKVKVQNIKLKLVDADNAMELARTTFNKTIGLQLNNATTITVDENQFKEEDYDYIDLTVEAANNRKELQILDYRKNASEKNITAAQSGWFPQIYAVGNYYNYKVSSDNFPAGSQTLKYWSAGLGLSWDIWNWGRNSAESEIAKEQKFQIEKNYNLLKQNIAVEVYKYFLRQKSVKQKISINKLAVESALLNYKITTNKYNSQVATSTDLIDAETDLLNAKVNLTSAKADYAIANVKLKFSIGNKLY